MQKFYYQESQLSKGQNDPLEPILSKCIFEIFSRENKQADLQEIVKNLVPDASEDETIKFIEKFC